MGEKKFIDADVLIQAFQEDYNKEGEKADDKALRGIADASVKYSHGQFCYLNAIERVKDAPAADVVEVVRCRDCIHFQPCFVLTENGERRPYTEEEIKNGKMVTGDVGINCASRCERFGYWDENKIPVWYNETDYCSYGERKEQT